MWVVIFKAKRTDCRYLSDVFTGLRPVEMPGIAWKNDDASRRIGLHLVAIEGLPEPDVTTAMPKGVETFGYVEGIWVSNFRYVLPLAVVLRQSLIEIGAVRLAHDGQNTKMELIYQYLTGPKFRHRIEAIVEKFSEMQSDLDKKKGR